MKWLLVRKPLSGCAVLDVHDENGPDDAPFVTLERTSDVHHLFMLLKVVEVSRTYFLPKFSNAGAIEAKNRKLHA